MSDPGLTFAHHGIAQAFTLGRWIDVRCDGRTMFVPPRDGRALFTVQAFGASSADRAGRAIDVRTMRHTPAGLDQTGIQTIALPSGIGRFGIVYSWAGHVRADTPLSWQLFQRRGGRVRLLNVAVKLDWLGTW